jgi:hypothetical protein
MPSIGNKIASGAKSIYRALVLLATWGAIGLAYYLFFPTVSEYLSRPGVLALAIGAIAVAIITLWREAARKPPRPNKKFLNKLLHSEPIIPNHDPPKAGGNFSSMADTAEGKRFFADFAPFAEIMNEWLADEYVGSRWRLPTGLLQWPQQSLASSPGAFRGRGWRPVPSALPDRHV